MMSAYKFLTTKSFCIIKKHLAYSEQSVPTIMQYTVIQLSQGEAHRVSSREGQGDRKVGGNEEVDDV